jgi:regulator of protease activity HflC (stomatin/prohibitin superfamily)
MVGSMLNLVNEVLQAAVGNLFRDKLGGMKATSFIETRQTVQMEAFEHISRQLDAYEVETRGVYIQDVIYPPELVKVLTEREIANQEIETFKKQKDAQDQRVATEAATGKADMQKDLARSEVGITIADNNANAKVAEGRGAASFTKQTGEAQADVIRAQGVAKAQGFKAQCDAIGQAGTLAVNVATVLADKKMQIMPQILVTGGGGGGSLEALAATLTKMFANQAGVMPLPEKGEGATAAEGA